MRTRSTSKRTSSLPTFTTGARSARISSKQMGQQVSAPSERPILRVREVTEGVLREFGGGSRRTPVYGARAFFHAQVAGVAKDPETRQYGASPFVRGFRAEP